MHRIYTANFLRRDTRVFTSRFSRMCEYICCSRHEDHRRDSSNLFIYLFFFKETLLSRKEIHGRKFPSLARFAMERVENVRSTSCGDIVGVILSLTRRRELREVREVSIFLHSRAIEWDVSSRGIYRCTLNMCVSRLTLISGATISVIDFGSPCIYTTDTQNVC